MRLWIDVPGDCILSAIKYLNLRGQIVGTSCDVVNVIQMEAFMKTWYKLTAILAVAAFLSGALTACGKKSDDDGAKITYGSLNSDGNIVTSKNSAVQGLPLDLSVHNISTMASGYQTGQASYNSYMPSAQVSFQLYVNGASQFGQATNQWSQWQQVGTFWAQSASACYDQGCQTVMLSLILTPATNNQNFEYRQIAIKKDVRANRVVGVREYTGPYNYLRSLDQMMREF